MALERLFEANAAADVDRRFEAARVACRLVGVRRRMLDRNPGRHLSRLRTLGGRVDVGRPANLGGSLHWRGPPVGATLPAR